MRKIVSQGRTKIIYGALPGGLHRAPPFTPRQGGVWGQREREVAKGGKLSNEAGDGKTSLMMGGNWHESKIRKRGRGSDEGLFGKR